MRTHRLTRLALALLAAASTAAAQPARRPERSAPVTDVRYEIAFDRALAARGRARITMTFATNGKGAVILALPRWTPGAYTIVNFSRYVAAFEAASGDRALRWERADDTRWRVRLDGARTVAVRFEIAADTLDDGMAWARPDFLLLNGTAAFLYPDGAPLDRYPARVTVRTESAWRVATALQPADSASTWQVASYHDLVDAPFFIGRFDVDSITVADRPLRLATYPVGSVAGERRARALDWLRRVVPPELAVFGTVPWQSYTVLQIADSAFSGAEGLEHSASHVDVIAASELDDPFVPSLYAHEIFHAWNVKRLRPSDLVPYRYDAQQPTAWLWMSEGVTDYYADLAELRGGVVDLAGFLSLTSDKVNEVAAAPPVSLEDASLATWVEPVDGTATIYYAKGSLVGLLLDALIRDASDNRRSLDDVMRELYRTTAEQGRGFTGDDWWGAVRRAANGRSFDDFARRWVAGRDSLPYADVFPLAGLRLVGDTARQAQLGLGAERDSSGVVVTAVEAGGAAAAAGVQPGDYLVALGDLPVSDLGFGARFRTKYAHARGATVPVRVRRAGRELVLQAEVRFVERVTWRVVQDARATAKARRIRAGIAAGTVDG